MATDERARLKREKYISLTTFRRDGRAVPTPMWFALSGDEILVYTLATSGKIKRLRHTQRVQVAPCTARGQVTGAPFEAMARILPAAEGPRVQEALNRKYGVIKRVYDVGMALLGTVRRRPSPERAYIAITPN